MPSLIHKKKSIHGGLPVIAGTRVPVSVLVSYAFEKGGLARAKEDYPHIKEDQILAAWAYAAKHLKKTLHGPDDKVPVPSR